LALPIGSSRLLSTAGIMASALRGPFAGRRESRNPKSTIPFHGSPGARTSGFSSASRRSRRVSIVDSMEKPRMSHECRASGSPPPGVETPRCLVPPRTINRSRLHSKDRRLYPHLHALTGSSFRLPRGSRRNRHVLRLDIEAHVYRSSSAAGSAHGHERRPAVATMIGCDIFRVAPGRYIAPLLLPGAYPQDPHPPFATTSHKLTHLCPCPQHVFGSLSLNRVSHSPFTRHHAEKSPINATNVPIPPPPRTQVRTTSPSRSGSSSRATRPTMGLARGP